MAYFIDELDSMGKRRVRCLMANGVNLSSAVIPSVDGTVAGPKYDADKVSNSKMC